MRALVTTVNNTLTISRVKRRESGSYTCEGTFHDNSPFKVKAQVYIGG